MDFSEQGGTIKLLVDLLNINKAEDEQKALLEELTDSVIAVDHSYFHFELVDLLFRTSCLGSRLFLAKRATSGCRATSAA